MLLTPFCSPAYDQALDGFIRPVPEFGGRRVDQIVTYAQQKGFSGRLHSSGTPDELVDQLKGFLRYQGDSRGIVIGTRPNKEIGHAFNFQILGGEVQFWDEQVLSAVPHLDDTLDGYLWARTG